MDPSALIWSGRALDLVEHENLDPASWEGATQADMRHYVSAGMALRQSLKSFVVISACVVMMVKNEADIVGLNLRHLYHLGFRRFLILDNGSSDETQAELRRCREAFHDGELIIVDDSTVRYTQSEKTTGLMWMATSFWPDLQWIFPIDADEFLCAETSLEGLSQLPADIDAIVLQKVNHYFTEFSLTLDIGNPLSRMPMRTHLGKMPPKVAVRASTEFVIWQGNHDIISRPGNPLRYKSGLDLGLYYREFQFRSYAQFKSKVVNGARALQAAERERGKSVGGDHWKGWNAELERGGDAGLISIFNHMAIKPTDELSFDPLTTASLHSST
ncbi:glycosyltransferase family 2 protein [Acidisoma sp. C75]